MKEKFKKAWEWTKEHKTEIGLGALAVVTTVGGVILFKKFTDPANIMKSIMDNSKSNAKGIGSNYLDIHDVGIGELTEAISYDNGSVELWVDNVPLKDMGELGETIYDHFYVNGVSKDSKVWALLYTYPNEVN